MVEATETVLISAPDVGCGCTLFFTLEMVKVLFFLQKRLKYSIIELLYQGNLVDVHVNKCLWSHYRWGNTMVTEPMAH